MRATQSHVVETTIEVEVEPNSREFCSAHKTQKVTALCLTCKVDICNICKQKAHLNHLFKRVEVIVNELKTQFTNRLKTVE